MSINDPAAGQEDTTTSACRFDTYEECEQALVAAKQLGEEENATLTDLNDELMSLGRQVRSIQPLGHQHIRGTLDEFKYYAPVMITAVILDPADGGSNPMIDAEGFEYIRINTISFEGLKAAFESAIRNAKRSRK